MEGVLRTIFIGLDVIIYGVLEQIFQLIINLANFDLFSGNVLEKFSTRIYLILGLVMVFKLMMSFIQILIDPDKMSDKERGVGNILKRVVISLILIVLVPSIFTFAKQLQNVILPVIPKVVLGVDADVDEKNIDYNATTTTANIKNNNEVMISTGRLMAYYSFLPFFYYSDEECNNGHLLGTTDDNDGSVTIRSVLDAASEVKDKNCPQAKDGYTYNYRYLMSTVVGIYLVYVLVTVALKVAIRTIKFGICQLIAPIPIASYIDPGLSKKSFDNWVNTTIKVYVDLFTRLLVVYFIVYVFSLLFDNNGNKIQEIIGKFGWFQGLLVLLFIIVGLLNFAKEMPKFVTGMLGLPEGFSDMADMFKGQGFKAIGDAVKLGTNPLTVAGSNAYNTLKQGGSVGKALRSAVAGGASAGLRGGRAILSGKDVGEAARIGREGAITARRNRAMDYAAGIGPMDRMSVRFKDYAGIDSKVTFGEQQIKSADAMLGDISKFKSTMTSLYAKYSDNIQLSGAGVENKVKKVFDDNDAVFSDVNFTGDARDAADRLRNGKGTYADLQAVKRFAQENSGKSVAISKLAVALQDDNEGMRDIQKAMFEQTLRGDMRNRNGAKSTVLNIDEDGADDDLKNIINTMRQTYNSNASTLGLDAGKFDERVQNLFGDDFEKKIKATREEARTNIGDGGRREAAARESEQRRRQNSQQNGGS